MNQLTQTQINENLEAARKFLVHAGFASQDLYFTSDTAKVWIDKYVFKAKSDYSKGYIRQILEEVYILLDSSSFSGRFYVHTRGEQVKKRPSRTMQVSPGKNGARLPNYRRLTAISMVEAGVGIKEIEKVTGLSRLYLYRFGARAIKGPSERKNVAIKMIEEGKTAEEIAEATGYSVNYLKYLGAKPTKSPLCKSHRKVLALQMIEAGIDITDIKKATGLSRDYLVRLGARSIKAKARKVLALQMIADGKTAEEIAEATGYAIGYLQNLGAKMIKSPPARKVLAIQMIKEGKGLREIAEATGYGKCTLYSLGAKVTPNSNQKDNSLVKRRITMKTRTSFEQRNAEAVARLLTAMFPEIHAALRADKDIQAAREKGNIDEYQKVLALKSPAIGKMLEERLKARLLH
ncbi:hypothetical protein [Geotalea sp. SG265]|uniref:hypothetical protein n=1 Tax=Geotalea sp. SG265 TaxID=2922867 RepID=UPI001FAF6236|nr:hypothetical protein [Geotalea sp. SG265]